MNQGYPTGSLDLHQHSLDKDADLLHPFLPPLGRDPKSWERVSDWLSIPWLCHGSAEEESGPLNFSEMGIAFSLRLATMLNSPKRVIQMLMEEGGGEEELDNGGQKKKINKNPVQNCSSQCCLSWLKGRGAEQLSLTIRDLVK